MLNPVTNRSGLKRIILWRMCANRVRHGVKHLANKWTWNPSVVPDFSDLVPALPKTNSHYPESVLDNEKWSDNETTTTLRITEKTNADHGWLCPWGYGLPASSQNIDEWQKCLPTLRQFRCKIWWSVPYSSHFPAIFDQNLHTIAPSASRDWIHNYFYPHSWYSFSTSPSYSQGRFWQNLDWGVYNGTKMSTSNTYWNYSTTKCNYTGSSVL